MLSTELNNRSLEQAMGNLSIDLLEICLKELAEFNEQLLETPIGIEPDAISKELSNISCHPPIELLTSVVDDIPESPIDCSILDEYCEETLDEYSDDYLDESSDEYLDSLIEEFTEESENELTDELE